MKLISFFHEIVYALYGEMVSRCKLFQRQVSLQCSRISIRLSCDNGNICCQQQQTLKLGVQHNMFEGWRTIYAYKVVQLCFVACNIVINPLLKWPLKLNIDQNKGPTSGEYLLELRITYKNDQCKHLRALHKSMSGKCLKIFY